MLSVLMFLANQKRFITAVRKTHRCVGQIARPLGRRAALWAQSSWMMSHSLPHGSVKKPPRRRTWMNWSIPSKSRDGLRTGEVGGQFAPRSVFLPPGGRAGAVALRLVGRTMCGRPRLAAAAGKGAANRRCEHLHRMMFKCYSGCPNRRLQGPPMRPGSSAELIVLAARAGGGAWPAASWLPSRSPPSQARHRRRMCFRRRSRSAIVP